jgi:hypothetical protein
MNAPKERGQESYQKVQIVVLMDDILTGRADETAFAMMRAVSEHLPDKARALWVDVEHISEELDKNDYDAEAFGSLNVADKEKIEELRTALKMATDELTAFIDSFISPLDPETVNELSRALADKDVSCVNSILENCANAKERMETRTEE